MPAPVLSSLDPKVQAIFDALDAYIQGTSWANATASVMLTGSQTTHTITTADRTNSNGVSYTERIAGVRVTIDPMSVTLSPGQSQQFTAAAYNPDGSAASGTFTWTLTQGAPGTLDANGLYTAPASLAGPASAQVNAAFSDGQAWASATVALQP